MILNTENVRRELTAGELKSLIELWEACASGLTLAQSDHKRQLKLKLEKMLEDKKNGK